MRTYGLTGGIGMGKSTAARSLADRGIAVIDTDQIARDLVEPGEPALVEIGEAFGATVISADGRLQRGELARLVFNDESARKRLETILHPRIRKQWMGQVATWREAGRAAAVVVIPLLFETGAQGEFDRIICLACTAATQHERLLARHWNEQQIAGRLASQWPVARKMELSHHVLWSEGVEGMLDAQLRRIIP